MAVLNHSRQCFISYRAILERTWSETTTKCIIFGTCLRPNACRMGASVCNDCALTVTLCDLIKGTFILIGTCISSQSSEILLLEFRTRTYLLDPTLLILVDSRSLQVRSFCLFSYFISPFFYIFQLTWWPKFTFIPFKIVLLSDKCLLTSNDLFVQCDSILNQMW